MAWISDLLVKLLLLASFITGNERARCWNGQVTSERAGDWLFHCFHRHAMLAKSCLVSSCLLIVLRIAFRSIIRDNVKSTINKIRLLRHSKSTENDEMFVQLSVKSAEQLAAGLLLRIYEVPESNQSKAMDTPSPELPH